MKRIPKYTVREVKQSNVGFIFTPVNIYPNKDKAYDCLISLIHKDKTKNYEIKKEWVNKKKRSWRKN
jgi:hypothetical protein